VILERVWPDRARVTPVELVADLGGLVISMVATLDGRAAIRGSSRPLGGPADLEMLLALRAAADVVLVGTGTVRAEGYGRLPVPAALISRSGDVPWDAGLCRDPGQRVLVYTAADVRAPDHVEVVRMADPAPARVLADLRARGLETVLCEGGPTLNRALLAAGVVDELFLTLSPLITGDDTEPAIVAGDALPGPPRLTLRSLAHHEGELYLRYSV
jgi:riboflavin biosynthesis pyrimidine reductase